jgi:hypothetical protein
MSISEKQLQIFDDLRRKSLARQLYYGDRLKDVRKKNKIIEGILTFVTAGTIVSLSIWRFIPALFLELTTSIFALLALILSIIKTQWKLAEEIERYSQLLYSYRLIQADFEEIEFSITRTKDMSNDDFKELYAAAWRRRHKVIENEDLDIDEKTIQNKLKARVDVLLPEENWRLAYISPRERLSKIQKDEGKPDGI